MRLRKQTAPVKEEHSHDDSADCSCEMLDTSLENVDDSDCSCSECLEANLEAFNELKAEEEEEEMKENWNKNNRGSTRVTSNKQTRGVSRNTVRNETKLNDQLTKYRSLGKERPTRPQTAGVRMQRTEQVQQYEQKQTGFPEFSRECINDYIRITQHRAREYLKERQNLQKQKEEEREKLKQMIKQNLQALKYTSKQIRSHYAEKQEKEEDSKSDEIHTHKWNHQPYHCKSRVQCRKKIVYEPDYEKNKEEIEKIKKRIRQYKTINKEVPYQCPDRCPKHHLRTSKKQLIKMEKFIQKKAKQYMEAQKKAKAEREEKKKIKEAKLRAIDIRCKDIVAKSKKYDPTIERTSFHNSIDHFSTFSELRQNKQQKMEEKQKRQKLKQAMKDGGQLEEAIYENIEDQLIDDHPPIQSKIELQSRYHERSQQNEEWCEKIVKDARLKPPKEGKQSDKAIKSQKQKQKAQQKMMDQSRKSTKKVTPNDLKKEQARRKEIQAQIERKKQQILKEFQKRNSTNQQNTKNEPKNKAIREQYEQKLHQKVVSPSSKVAKVGQKQEKYDPYKQNYKHNPNKTAEQMNIVGDPVMQEYQHHKNSRRAKELQADSSRDIFTKSGTALMGKNTLKV